MMTLKQLQELKRQLGMTNEDIARMTGVPLSTVQKVFGGTVKAPRRKTLEALSGPMEEVRRKTLLLDQVADEWQENMLLHDSGENQPAEYGGRVHEMAFQYISDPSGEENSGAKGQTDRHGGRMKGQREYTVEDYYAWPEDERVELIDGRIYMMATPAVNHQRIVLRISNQILKCLDEHESKCEIMIAPVSVQLDKDNRTMVEPDILIVCDETIITERCVYGAPDFVLEVLSPSSRSKDMILKHNKYYNAGCREYWIVDPKKEEVIVHDYEHEEFDIRYSFDDKVPLRISEGKCVIDFAKIKSYLK